MVTTHTCLKNVTNDSGHLKTFVGILHASTEFLNAITVTLN